MKRPAIILNLLAVLVLTSCRSDAAAPTTTPTTKAPFGVVIAQCRLVEDTVTLLNQANSARNLNGWTIHDEGRENEYEFFNDILDHTKTKVIMSGPDAMMEANGRDELPWPGAEDVWDDTGDTAYLRNPAGDLIDQRECT
ncbi:MAG: lamin tail domain-containing protein [Acidimicrobiia bacterium]|nr:lamin tail domain-containing protein [Acidimicrobiia bacterium]MBT8192909.1 lamin tail domain-containing protein [Acidimicrobiia bacterium]MBT8248348.1 lamin tail domain-containing protein [Acidimicrobiia bacterium]NNJ47496.1 lamin tail domain-containing protein [Acidimicrobiia bacterium]